MINWKNTTRALGGMKPAEALVYMKETPDLVIVQVNVDEWKIEPGFTGRYGFLTMRYPGVVERFRPEGPLCCTAVPGSSVFRRTKLCSVSARIFRN